MDGLDGGRMDRQIYVCSTLYINIINIYLYIYFFSKAKIYCMIYIIFQWMYTMLPKSGTLALLRTSEE